MKARRLAMVVSLLGVLCALPSIAKEPFPMDVGHPPPRYQLLIQDNPANLRFDLVLLSHDDRPICISHGGWPDALGHVDWGGRDVKVESLRRSFPARDWDFGYCPHGECTTRIPPHGTLKGFVNYIEFGDPKEIADLPQRNLIFETIPHLCSLDTERLEKKTSPAKNSAKVNHLVPVNEKELPPSRANLESKLLITPADIARIIVGPARQPECAVSVYSNSPSSADDVPRYIATLTRISASISSGQEPVQIVRKDAELPASAALPVREVWKQMLVATRSHESPIESPVDGGTIEVSLSGPNQSPLRGQLPVNPDESISAFEQLGTLLVKYCEASASERDALAKEIEKRGKSLLKTKANMKLSGPKDSLRIPLAERKVLKKKAKQGDTIAAVRLSSYYSIYQNNRELAVRYLKLGAQNNSDVAITKLMTLYSTDSDLFDFKKALVLREQLKKIAETQKISLKPDADWGYDRYGDLLRTGDKRRGLFFLEYAATKGSESALKELIELYSKDPNLRNTKKAHSWKQKLDASGRLTSTVGTLALISKPTDRSPSVFGGAEFTPVRILGKEAVIVPQVYLRESGLSTEGYWTPKTSQLREVERSLPTFLRKEMQSHPVGELSQVIALEPKYRRQYGGVILNGRKVIWVNCIPKKAEKGVDPFANWNRQIIDVSDGGSDFWGVVYDVEKHSFDRLILNGSA